MTAPWCDPELVARGREPMHALWHEPGLLLDGAWRFELLPQPDAEPTGACDKDRCGFESNLSLIAPSIDEHLAIVEFLFVIG